MPDATLHEPSESIPAAKLPRYCVVCGKPAVKSVMHSISRVLDDVDGPMLDLLKMGAAVADSRVTGKGEQVTVAKCVEAPYCEAHAAESSKAGVSWELAIGVGIFAWLALWMWLAIKLQFPVLFLVGMAPLFWLAVKLQSGAFASKAFDIELIDANRIKFRNASEPFAAELIRMEWRRVHGEDPPPLAEGGRGKTVSDNPFV